MIKPSDSWAFWKPLSHWKTRLNWDVIFLLYLFFMGFMMRIVCTAECAVPCCSALPQVSEQQTQLTMHGSLWSSETSKILILLGLFLQVVCHSNRNQNNLKHRKVYYCYYFASTVIKYGTIVLLNYDVIANHEPS